MIGESFPRPRRPTRTASILDDAPTALGNAPEDATAVDGSSGKGPEEFPQDTTRRGPDPLEVLARKHGIPDLRASGSSVDPLDALAHEYGVAASRRFNPREPLADLVSNEPPKPSDPTPRVTVGPLKVVGTNVGDVARAAGHSLGADIAIGRAPRAIRELAAPIGRHETAPGPISTLADIGLSNVIAPFSDRAADEATQHALERYAEGGRDVGKIATPAALMASAGAVGGNVGLSGVPVSEIPEGSSAIRTVLTRAGEAAAINAGATGLGSGVIEGNGPAETAKRMAGAAGWGALLGGTFAGLPNARKLSKEVREMTFPKNLSDYEIQTSLLGKLPEADRRIIEGDLAQGTEQPDARAGVALPAIRAGEAVGLNEPRAGRPDLSALRATPGSSMAYAGVEGMEIPLHRSPDPLESLGHQYGIRTAQAPASASGVTLDPESAARELGGLRDEFTTNMDALRRGVDPETQKPWTTSPKALGRRQSVASTIENARGRYTDLIDELRATHGDDAARSLLNQHKLPHELQGDLSTALSAGAQGFVPDETGTMRYATARTDAGTLRANLADVHTDALVKELADLYDAHAADANQTAPTTIGEEGSGVGFTSVWTGRKQGAAYALGRMASRQRSISRVEAELAQRGLSSDDVSSGIEALHGSRVEREGLQRDAKPRTVDDDFIRDEQGNVLFSPKDFVPDALRGPRPVRANARDPLLAPENAGPRKKDRVTLDPERLDAYAVELPDGSLIEGHSTMDAAHRAVQAGLLDHVSEVGNLRTGFITSRGRFVNKSPGREWLRIAFAAGQLDKRSASYRALAQGADPLHVAYGGELRRTALRGPADGAAESEFPVQGTIQGGAGSGGVHIVTRAVRLDLGNGTDVYSLDEFWPAGYQQPKTKQPIHAIEGYQLSDGSFITRAQAKERFGGQDAGIGGHPADIGPEGRDPNTGEALFDPDASERGSLEEQLARREQHPLTGLGEQMRAHNESEGIEARAARQGRLGAHGGTAVPSNRNPYRPESPAHDAYNRAYEDALDPTRFGEDLPERARLTPDGRIAVTGDRSSAAQQSRADLAESETLRGARDIQHSPEQEGADLFGDSPLEKLARKHGIDPTQETIFGGREGTEASRNLAQTESAARSELERLREALPRETDAGRRVQTAKRIADLEKLVNRGEVIGGDELSARASSKAPIAEGPDQLALLSPDIDPTPFGRRVLFALGLSGREQAGAFDRVKSLKSISQNFANMVDFPLRQGRFMAGPRQARGAFFPQSEVARVIRWDKLDTAVHEGGHFVSKKYLLNPTTGGARARGAPALTQQMKAELVKLGRDLYGSRKPAGGYGEEGIAQWMRFAVTEPERLKADAPEFTAWMEKDVLAKEPALKAAIDQARLDFEAYKNAPATARVDAMLSIKTGARQMPDTRTLSRSLLDDLRDIREAVQELGGASTPEKDAYVLARLTRGGAGVAEEMIERGIVNPANGQRVTRGIAEILGELKPQDVQPFRRYLVAERARELWGRGIDPGVSLSDAREIVVAGREAGYTPRAQELWNVSNALLDYREAKGLLTSGEVAHIKKLNQKRVGFYRVFDESETASGRGTGKGFAKNSSGLQSIKGSAREIIDPLESIVTDVYKTVQQSHASEVMHALYEHALRTEGGGRVIEELTEIPKRLVRIPVEQVKAQIVDLGFEPPEGGLSEMTGVLNAFEELKQGGPRETKDLVFPIVYEGERKWLQIKDAPLYNALQGLGTPVMPTWLRFLSIPTRVLRAGATLTFEFIGRNPARDAWTAAIYSRAGSRPPFWDFSRGLFHALRQDATYQRWKLAGADNAAMLGLDRPEVQKHLADIMRSRGARAAGWVLHPIDRLRMLSSLGENATRIGEFAGVERQALKRGASPKAATTEGAFASRDVTIDFAKAGVQTRIANQIVAFLNANVQGMDKLAREMRDRPGTVIPRIAAYITVPSIALYLSQKDDPAYREVPAWQKAVAWVIVQRDEHGKVAHIWRIPKPPELGILFGSVPERILEWVHTHDPHALDEAWQSMSQLNPIHWPDAIRPLIETWANKSALTDRRIVPEGLTSLPPSEQATRYTGAAARAVGSATNTSPAKIEHLVRGYAGGLGQYGLSAGDRLVEAAQGANARPTEEASDALTRIPGVSGFTIREPGLEAESVQRTLSDFDEANAKRLKWLRLLKSGETQAAQSYLTENRPSIASVSAQGEAGPRSGVLRAVHQRLTELQQRDAEVSEKVHDMLRARQLHEQIRRDMIATAVRYRGLVHSGEAH